MNLESRFLQIRSFLLEHQELVQTEVLESFTELPKKYKVWTEDFENLTSLELIELENTLSSLRLHNSDYINFLETVQSLCSLKSEIKPKTEPIPLNLKRKMSLKKQHEILQIKEFLAHKNYSSIIDIGSGAGHLTSLLLHNAPSKESVCIDMSKENQEIGIKKLKREAPEILERINFIQVKIDKNFSIHSFKFDLLMGLHTCGDLAVELMRAFKKTNNSSFFNFGCCYHKLSDCSINISVAAKQNPIFMPSHHARTMAAKSYKNLTTKEYDERMAVKNYRYAIHLFMNKELDLPFQTLGNANVSDYKQSFATYVKKFLPQASSFTDKSINDFYQSQLKEIQLIQRLGIIRSHISRVVELYIILDRALYLKESKPDVEISEFFDRNISPRNIGIWVQK